MHAYVHLDHYSRSFLERWLTRLIVINERMHAYLTTCMINTHASIHDSVHASLLFNIFGLIKISINV